MPTALPAAIPASTFSLIIDGLCRAVGAHTAVDRSAGPLLTLIWNYLRRLSARFTSLAARAQAGPLPPPRNRTKAPQTELRPPRQNRLPGRTAWLIRLVPRTAAFGGQVQHLLAQPEFVALIEAAPRQTGRLLRPLCRALAVPLPAALQRRPRPRKSRTTPAEEPKPPEMRARTEPYRRRPRTAPPPGTVWRRWCGLWMPEAIRETKPA